MQLAPDVGTDDKTLHREWGTGDIVAFIEPDFVMSPGSLVLLAPGGDIGLFIVTEKFFTVG
ncbi:MAG: hypothetical protein GY792_04175 [Gammaproteobacteria bacterium]|nr:hypothetical protein [Gammaproteobacteria bacterium]